MSINSPYELINPPSFRKALERHKFIYVLMLNIEEGIPLRPFYVGQATSVKNRFNNHQQITWHYAKFSLPVKVWVAGMVKESIASEAEQDLIARVTRAGHVVTNTVITNRQSQKSMSGKKLFASSKEEIISYINSSTVSKVTLDEWAETWGAILIKKGKQADKLVPVPKKRVTTNNQSINTYQIKSYLSSRKFPNSNVKYLAELISEYWNPKTKTATLNINKCSLYPFDAETARKVHTIWAPVEKLDPNKSNTFFLPARIIDDINRGNY